MLRGREREYILDCLDSNWISSAGEYVDRFEREFAEFCGTRFAVACCNGTAAIHLALAAAGIGPGDEVIVPSLTYVASVNPIRYVGATPVLVDSETTTWNLDPTAVAAAVTPSTKAIVVVHLYGHPAEMDAILAIAEQHGLTVIEDAAEAHGATHRGRKVGSIGDLGTFSFYGNKIITTGEGGMVVCNSEEMDGRLRQLRNQGQYPDRRYWFPIIGYNYRMTNLCAAIGVAQLEGIEWQIARRREIAEWYRADLAGLTRVTLSPQAPWAQSVYWLTSLLLAEGGQPERDYLRKALDKHGIESRPFFFPVHTLPPYVEAAKGRAFPVAESLSASGLNLPSGPALSREDVSYISSVIRQELA